MVPARTAGLLGGLGTGPDRGRRSGHGPAGPAPGRRGPGAVSTGHGVQVAKAVAAAINVTVMRIDGRSTSIVWRLDWAARHASPMPITTTIGAPGVRRRQES